MKHNRNLKRRRWLSALFLLTLVAIFLIGPVIYRLEQLRQAKINYDVQKTQEELGWFEKLGGHEEKLRLVKDTKLWVALNLGNKDVEPLLAAYQDEDYQFWLVEYYLQAGELTKAKNSLERMSPSPHKQLGKGLLALATGDTDQTRNLLAETTNQWKSLSRQEQGLRHLTLAQAALILEDEQTCETELQAAQQLDPKNPACLIVGFNFALAEGQWAKARELSNVIGQQSWSAQNSLYQTKRAVLAIQDEDAQALEESLILLKKLPQGEASVNYVNGIEALKKGEMPKGQAQLKLALESGLEGDIKTDAQRALDQVSERQKAEPVLRTLQ